MKRVLLVAIAVAVLILLASILRGEEQSPFDLAPLIQIQPRAANDNFLHAEKPRSLTVPSDHGPHPGFQTEWWYFTGNLSDDEGKHFGYQLTFFRRALSPNPIERVSSLASDQIFFAHFAITDVENEQHEEVERFSRGADLLAGAEGEPLRVWLEDWVLEALNNEGTNLHLHANADGLALDLDLISQKPIVAHGDSGLSLKSLTPGNASYYLSYTRLETRGEISVGGETYAVDGESWFDHEWSTSSLGELAVGWDWFGLQLSDGRDLMFYIIRNRDGSVDKVSAGTLVEADGSTVALALEDFEVQVLDHWESARTGAVYPNAWKVIVEEHNIELDITPWIRDQEMNISFIYWEGAVSINGQSGGLEVSGNGYVELTGYVESLQGVF